jgi:hypothetical protein
VKFIYELKVFDHTTLGGPMGTEYTQLIKSWVCTSLRAAKELAHQHNTRVSIARNRKVEVIHWSRPRIAEWESQDMLFHGYTILEHYPITITAAKKGTYTA